MNSGEASALPHAPRLDRSCRAAPGATGDLDEISTDFEQAIWAEDFRQGSCEIDLCGTCGRPTGVYLSLGEWVEHSVICTHCMTEHS